LYWQETVDMILWRHAGHIRKTSQKLNGLSLLIYIINKVSHLIFLPKADFGHFVKKVKKLKKVVRSDQK